MKSKVLLVTVFLMMFTVASLAVDSPSFVTDYADGGIDYAVSQQLMVGSSVSEIIADAMLVDGMTRRDILEALQRADVQINLMDAVGYSAVYKGGNRFNRHANHRVRVYASPSTFEQ